MNIILFEKDEISTQTIVLNDRRAKHLVKILKVSVGDRLRVGIINSVKGEACVLRCSSGYPFEVELELQWFEEVEKKPPIDLIVALPRPIMLRRIFSQAAALGVGSLQIIHAGRVEKSFWNATLLQEEESRSHLVQGLEQAVATRLPKVGLHRGFKSFIENWLNSNVDNYGLKVLAHPCRINIPVNSQVGLNTRILAAVGPEGGWLDYEVQRFTEYGFSSISMGDRILKVDTAVVALHSRLSLLLEQQHLP
ncbi:MAG: RsmE family RNA methyltransferase [Thermodesulfobacteriota bacterium]